MKKVLPILTLVGLLAGFWLPVAALAAVEQPGGTAPTIVSTGAGLIETITRIGDWAFIVLIALASVFLIAAGFLWITAGGEPEGITKARQMLINSLIGVVIALLARGLVQVVRSILGG